MSPLIVISTELGCFHAGHLSTHFGLAWDTFHDCRRRSSRLNMILMLVTFLALPQNLAVFIPDIHLPHFHLPRPIAHISWSFLHKAIFSYLNMIPYVGDTYSHFHKTGHFHARHLSVHFWPRMNYTHFMAVFTCSWGVSSIELGRFRVGHSSAHF
jgi:hypothetical protein